MRPAVQPLWVSAVGPAQLSHASADEPSDLTRPHSPQRANFALHSLFRSDSTEHWGDFEDVEHTLQSSQFVDDLAPAEAVLFDPESRVFKESEPHWLRSELQKLWQDQLNFYAPRRLAVLGGILAVGGVMANTPLDQHIRDLAYENIADTPSDEWAEMFHLNKEFGEGTRTLPLFGAAWLIGVLGDEVPLLRGVGDWGEQSLRIFTVGAVPLIVLQRATGGSRPGETDHTSQWRPLQDSNGVSGHSFMGALPFLAAANLVENPWARYSLMAASTLPGISRITDGRHYASQVVIGWSIAFLASASVRETELSMDQSWGIVPIPVSHGHGMGIELRW